MSHVMVVFSDALPGAERELEAWYTGVHLPEILETPGFRSARVFRRAGSDDGDESQGYLAVYEVEGELDDAQRALAAGNEKRTPPTAMAPDLRIWWYTAVD
jgi:hypothetical protein